MPFKNSKVPEMESARAKQEGRVAISSGEPIEEITPQTVPMAND